jgi:hypothetical protein
MKVLTLADREVSDGQRKRSNLNRWVKAGVWGEIQPGSTDSPLSPTWILLHLNIVARMMTMNVKHEMKEKKSLVTGLAKPES